MPAVSVPAGGVGAHEVALTAATVLTVTFGDDLDAVQIVSDGAASLYFTLDGSTPTVGSTSCYYLPATASSDIRQPKTSGGTVVKVISSGTPTVTVQRND